MVKLLRADLAHMRKSRSFWVCVILSFTLSVVNIITANPGWEEQTSRIILDGTSNSVVFMSIFAALFLGTGYSDNTIRNKLIIGSKRADVYFSSLITITIGGLLIHLAKIIPTAVAACFGKSFGMDTDKFSIIMITIIIAMVAISAVFTLLGMLITSKSANTAITITSSFVLIMVAAIIISLLTQPEFYPSYEITADGVTQMRYEPNPGYIKEGTARNILTAVNDILPTGQLLQIETGEPHNSELMPLYSLGVLAVSTAAGVVVFRKKDIK